VNNNPDDERHRTAAVGRRDTEEVQYGSAPRPWAQGGGGKDRDVLIEPVEPQQTDRINTVGTDVARPKPEEK
jgi:hypothetical protein